MPKDKKNSSKRARIVPYARGFKLPTEKQQSKALDFDISENIPSHFIADVETFKPIPRYVCSMVPLQFVFLLNVKPTLYVV